jgi:hypothetical protein
MVVCSEIHTKHINTLCVCVRACVRACMRVLECIRQTLCKVKPVGTHSNHLRAPWFLKNSSVYLV